MIDKYIVGKLKNMLIVETEQDNEISTLFLPRNVIIEMRLSSDYEHNVTDEDLKEISDYLAEHKIEIKNIYYP